MDELYWYYTKSYCDLLLWPKNQLTLPEPLLLIKNMVAGDETVVSTYCS